MLRNRFCDFSSIFPKFQKADRNFVIFGDEMENAGVSASWCWECIQASQEEKYWSHMLFVKQLETRWRNKSCIVAMLPLSPPLPNTHPPPKPPHPPAHPHTTITHITCCCWGGSVDRSLLALVLGCLGTFWVRESSSGGLLRNPPRPATRVLRALAPKVTPWSRKTPDETLPRHPHFRGRGVCINSPVFARQRKQKHFPFLPVGDPVQNCPQNPALGGLPFLY